MNYQPHPYADHPVTAILDDHDLSYWSRGGTLAHCTCGTVTAASHAAHLAEMLHQAGLLADGPPPETPTARVLAERADRRTT